MKRTQQNPFYHGEGDVYTHTQMVYRELIEMPDLISFRETVCALVRHHMLPIHLMVREDPERKIQEVAALGDLSGTGDSPLFHFLCDKPWGTSRACTKMYPMANGQSSLQIKNQVGAYYSIYSGHTSPTRNLLYEILVGRFL